MCLHVSLYNLETYNFIILNLWVHRLKIMLLDVSFLYSILMPAFTWTLQLLQHPLSQLNTICIDVCIFILYVFILVEYMIFQLYVSSYSAVYENLKNSFYGNVNFILSVVDV